jgi:hypothetical protein
MSKEILKEGCPVGILLLLISNKRRLHVWEYDGEVDVLALNELNGAGVW